MLSIFLGIAGCGKEDLKGSEATTPADMLQIYKEKVDIGIPVRKARELMMADGFQVTEESGAKWRGKFVKSFLRCTRDDGQIVKRRWEIAIIHDGEAVTAVDLRSATVYP